MLHGEQQLERDEDLNAGRPVWMQAE